ncbi:hypothetical protein IF2G_06410 [Cordyceps javanica]|nr:hypothetical protein IF2G_06410 [Cordyceps javanica]
MISSDRKSRRRRDARPFFVLPRRIEACVSVGRYVWGGELECCCLQLVRWGVAMPDLQRTKGICGQEREKRRESVGKRI